MKLDSLYESAPMRKLQEWGTWFQENKVFGAISSGMMCSMSLILAGAVFTIIATLLEFAGLVETTDALYEWLTTPYNMTMGIMAVPIAFAVGYVYTQKLEVGSPLANGIVCLVMFLMVASPMQTVELADGTSLSALDTTYLGGTGIFTALFMPIIVVQIITQCAEHHVTIRMPDAVPQALSDSFATLVPLVLNIVLWSGLNTLCETFAGATLPGAIMNVLAAPLSALVSGPGMLVLILIEMLFWSFGIHGTMIVYVVVITPLMEAYATNATLVAAGEDPVFSTVLLFMAASCCGGTGNLLPVAVHCLQSKSEQLKSVGKAGIVPALFNISEPIVFGMPIIFNPLLAIPFILSTVLCVAVVWGGYAIGFFQPAYILITGTLPIGLMEFLSSMAWQNLFIPVVGFVVGYLVYLPFVRVYDRQCLEKEAAAAASPAEG